MYALGIDLGASALKIMVVDAGGVVVEEVRHPINTYHPHPGWAEQKPSDWWQALDVSLQTLKARAPQIMRSVGGAGVTAGAHIAVLCDAANQPLANAMLWSDQRASQEALALRETGHDVAIAGNRAQPTWTMPQLMWLVRHRPDIWQACQRIFFAKDWLRHQLTGDHFTDPGDACGALLSDWQDGQWSPTLLGMLGPHLPDLPVITNAAAQAGTIAAPLAQKWGLPHDVPVIVSSIDTSMEWYCFGTPRAGATSIKLASAGVVACFNDHATPKPPLSLYPDPVFAMAHHLSGAHGTAKIKGSSKTGDAAIADSTVPRMSYYAAGMNQCIGAVEWGRALFMADETEYRMWQKIDTAAANGVDFFPYLLGERAPLWQSDLTGALTGLTRASDDASIMRAIIEGVCCAFRDIIESYGHLGLHMSGPFHLLGGGARHDIWCQILADIVGQELIRPAYTDAAFGVAQFVRRALDPSTAQSVQSEPTARHFEPQKQTLDEIYPSWRQARDGLYRS